MSPPRCSDRNLGIAGILHYAVLRLPGELIVALPLAALLGSMSAFYAMARSREITALRSAGVGLRRMLVFLIPVPIVLARAAAGAVPVAGAHRRSRA